MSRVKKLDLVFLVLILGNFLYFNNFFYNLTYFWNLDNFFNFPNFFANSLLLSLISNLIILPLFLSFLKANTSYDAVIFNLKINRAIKATILLKF